MVEKNKILSKELRAEGLTLFRGDRCLFRNLDLAVGAGEIVHVQGPNGSGKTTLLRTLAGLTLAEEGEVYWCGRPARQVRQDFAAAVAWSGHRDALKGELTLVENLRFDLGLRRDVAPDAIETAMRRLGVAAQAHIPAAYLSAGQRRRTALARVLLLNAPLWLLDEPFTNLDHEARALTLELIAEHRAAGGSCLLAAHQDLDLPGVRRLRLDGGGWTDG